MAYLIDPLHLEGEPFQKPIGYQTNERSRVDAQRIMGAWHQQVLISIFVKASIFFPHLDGRPCRTIILRGHVKVSALSTERSSIVALLPCWLPRDVRVGNDDDEEGVVLGNRITSDILDSINSIVCFFLFFSFPAEISENSRSA